VNQTTKPTKVEYRRLKTFGRFENVQFGIEGDIEAGETPDEAYAKAVDIVEGQIAAKITGGDVDKLEQRIKRDRERLDKAQAALFNIDTTNG
jgi:hypothetical protein